MSLNINIPELSATIERELSAYSEEVAAHLKEDIKDAAQEMVNELRRTSPNDTGEYARGWANRVEHESDEDIRVVVYNKTRPSLTHLLENGHAKVNGGRTEARPHIRPAADRAGKRLEQKVKVSTKQ